MQAGRNERKTRQIKTEKRTKKVQSRANRISEGMVSGTPVGSGILQGKIIDFPLGRASSFQERWLLCSPGIFWP